MLSREGMPSQIEVVPVVVRENVQAYGLQVPAHDLAQEEAFGLEPVPFIARANPAPVIDLSSHLSLQDGVGEVQVLQDAAQTYPARALLGRMLVAEGLFQHALTFLRQQGIQQVWVTLGEAGSWLDGLQVLVPLARIPVQLEDRVRLQHEILAQWEAALARTLRRARLAFLTRNPLLKPITRAHANFPMQTMPDGNPKMGYRVEAMLAQDVVKAAVAALGASLRGVQLKPQGWDRILGVVREEAGAIDLKATLEQVMKAIDAGTDTDTFGPPLPRLHVPQHLYNPLLLAASATPVNVGEQFSLLDDYPVTLRITPPPLQDSEARLVWDLRRVWDRIHKQPEWAGVDVVLLRNLAGVGVGLFAGEGFYPDFLLWLKRDTLQALAFVEPKGLRHQWPQDKFDLLDQTVPSWKFPVPVRGYVHSANSESELRKIQPGFSWAAAPASLMKQDADGLYVEELLKKLMATLSPKP